MEKNSTSELCNPAVKLCLIIPNYNHGNAMAATLAALKPYGLHCIIIDDGSDEPTRSQLAALADADDMITLHRSPLNLGKGGAVMNAFYVAKDLGFSHCLQIDADGQHACEDIPKFIVAAEQQPDALICGQPLYDESAPKGRLIARNITHFWVGVETWSMNPPDTMCGFRVYPLAKMFPIIKKHKPGLRMDFDIEIMVRFIWTGAPVVRIPTKVTYPEDGLSNFDYIRDNILISWMHTRLFFLMLKKIPVLLQQKLKTRSNVPVQHGDSRHWSVIKERGSNTGIVILFKVYQILGRIPFQIALAPVITYYYFSNKNARSASQEFLLKAYQTGSDHPSLQHTPGHKAGLQHFFEFGRAALDKVASWSGSVSLNDIRFDRRDEITRLMDSGTGAVIIGSHLGNLEVCRALSQMIPNFKMKVLVFTEHAQKFNGFLKKLNPSVQKDVIPVHTLGPDTAIQLKQYIDSGYSIVIVGDRTGIYSSNRVSTANFLGSPAAFSQGPFILAALMECPVYLMFCLREKKKYDVYLEDFADKVVLPRQQRQITLDALIQRYAQRLEYYSLKQPLQWFNFYSFWSPKSATTD